MELKKVLTPWNWFKKEEEETKPSQVQVVNSSRLHPLDRLHEGMGQLFDDFFRGFPASRHSRDYKNLWGDLIRPNVDIAENSKEYTITVEVPGVEEKDLELTLAEGTLTVRGEKRSEKEDQDKQYHRIERSYGYFQRIISLPNDADENEIQAKFKNGVLSINVKKSANAEPSGRKIAVNE